MPLTTKAVWFPQPPRPPLTNPPPAPSSPPWLDGDGSGPGHRPLPGSPRAPSVHLLNPLAVLTAHTPRAGRKKGSVLADLSFSTGTERFLVLILSPGEEKPEALYCWPQGMFGTKGKGMWSCSPGFAGGQAGARTWGALGGHTQWAIAPCR